MGTFSVAAIEAALPHMIDIAEPAEFVAGEAWDFIDNVTLPGDKHGPRGEVPSKADQTGTVTRERFRNGDGWSDGRLSVSGSDLNSRVTDCEGWRVCISKPVEQALLAVIGPKILWSAGVALDRLNTAEDVVGVQVDSGSIDRLKLAAQVQSWRRTLVQPIEECAGE